jgi:hypothetical protein
VNWCIIVDDTARKHIDEICGGEESFIPKFEWHGHFSEKGKTNFNYVAMFTLSRSILLMSMRT